jgi:hypothetical protein
MKHIVLFQLIFLAALAVTMAMVPVNKKPGNFKIIRDGLVVYKLVVIRYFDSVSIQSFS